MEQRFVVTGKTPDGREVKHPQDKRDYSGQEASDVALRLVEDGYTEVKVEDA